MYKFYILQLEIIIILPVPSNLHMHICIQNGNTPLHIAVIDYCDLEMCKALVRGGADVRLRNNNGETALEALEDDYNPRGNYKGLCEYLKQVEEEQTAVAAMFKRARVVKEEEEKEEDDEGKNKHINVDAPASPSPSVAEAKVEVVTRSDKKKRKRGG